ncbi:LapA family protein [Streptomyces sp. B6B3]|uniref:LapA family protein n=1 Tax=Streptomyces sp. B6B3 TaxID=3153570 RepID=UPI00325D2A22
MSTRSPGQRGQRNPKGPSGEFFTPGRIVLMVIAALTLVFIFENNQRTKIRLLIPEVTMPLWFALLGTAVIGALCGVYLARRPPR